MEKTKPNKSKRAKTENVQFKLFLQIELFSIITYIVLFLLGSVIALNADLPSKYDYISALIIFAISSFITGFIAGIKLRQNGLLAGILYSLPMRRYGRR